MNKKVLIPLAILIITIIITVIIIVLNTNKEKPEDIFQSYISKINDKNYDDMYEMLSSNSKNNISKEDFVTKNKKIYEGIDCSNLKIDITSSEEENKNAKIS